MYFVAVLLSVIALSIGYLPLPSKAQTQGEQIIYTISADGSVSPQTTLIKQTGSTYTLIDDVDSSIAIIIQKSDITLDGLNHKVTEGLISIGTGPLSTIPVTNVTVQNFFITNTQSGVIGMTDASNITFENNTITGGVSPFGQLMGIALDNSNSVSIIGNTLENDMGGISLSESNSCLIMGNTIMGMANSWGYDSAAIILLRSSSNNLIYDNQFVNNQHEAQVDSTSMNSWDNGKIGNYWDDYLTMYPNATEIDNSGIGNTPYKVNDNNIDHYPLMYQAYISPVPTQTPNPTPTLAPSPTPAAPEFPVLAVLPLFLSVFYVIVILRYRKTANTGDRH